MATWRCRHREQGSPDHVKEWSQSCRWAEPTISQSTTSRLTSRFYSLIRSKYTRVTMTALVHQHSYNLLHDWQTQHYWGSGSSHPSLRSNRDFVGQRLGVVSISLSIPIFYSESLIHTCKTPSRPPTTRPQNPKLTISQTARLWLHRPPSCPRLLRNGHVRHRLHSPRTLHARIEKRPRLHRPPHRRPRRHDPRSLVLRPRQSFLTQLPAPGYRPLDGQRAAYDANHAFAGQRGV